MYSSITVSAIKLEQISPGAVVDQISSIWSSSIPSKNQGVVGFCMLLYCASIVLLFLSLYDFRLDTLHPPFHRTSAPMLPTGYRIGKCKQVIMNILVSLCSNSHQP